MCSLSLHGSSTHVSFLGTILACPSIAYLCLCLVGLRALDFVCDTKLVDRGVQKVDSTVLFVLASVVYAT